MREPAVKIDEFELAADEAIAACGGLGKPSRRCWWRMPSCKMNWRWPFRPSPTALARAGMRYGDDARVGVIGHYRPRFLA